MANRRKLKKSINALLGDVIEECYDSLLSNEGKNEQDVDVIIDEAVDLADDVIAKVNSAKKLKTRSEIKKHFSELKEQFGDKTIGFIEKLNKL